MSEQRMIEVVARSKSTVMTVNKPDQGLTPQQLAEMAVVDWQAAADRDEAGVMEGRYANEEGLLAHGDGFELTVTVGGQVFRARMRPVINWVVEAIPEPA